MKKLILTLTLFFGLMTQAYSDTLMTGKAYNLKNELIYIEKHSVVHKDGLVHSITTEYFKPGETKPFALLESSFDPEKPFWPTITFKDFRTNYEEVATPKPNKYMISLTTGKNVDKGTVSLKSNSILGQGYHNYILKHLDSFNGKRMVKKVDFVVPANIDSYNLNFIFEPADKKEHVKVKLEMSSFFLSLFVDQIEVTYNKQDKSLIEYFGLTNIVDDKGEKQRLRIKYTYDKEV